MATFVIGDVQGCYETLTALLERCKFSPDRDRLWCVGDLVNRGPRSLDVLRFLKNLGDRAVVVLGNHDLHLLARYAGLVVEKARDTLDEVLRAPDVEELIAWLASRPLIHQEGEFTMVHAGLLPSWTIARAFAEAKPLEASLRNSASRKLLLEHRDASPQLKGLTTIRTCHADDTLCKYSGPPETAPPGCIPWFEHPRRQSRDGTVIFGHWSALGYRRGPDYLALDSGCVWGKTLTAVCLENGLKFEEPAREPPLG